MKRPTRQIFLPLAFLSTTFLLAAADAPQKATVKGHVLDSACAFTKDLKKPVSTECALSCAKASSPLVILAQDGTIYWPIAGATPADSQNSKLLPFAGEKVVASGRIYERGGSKAIVIDKIDRQAAK